MKRILTVFLLFAAGLAAAQHSPLAPLKPYALTAQETCCAGEPDNSLGVIWKSLDSGETWQPLATFPAAFPYRLLIDPRSPDTLYLVTWMKQPVRPVPPNSSKVIRWM